VHSQVEYTHENVYKINKNIHIYLCIISMDYAQKYVYNGLIRSSKTDLQQATGLTILKNLYHVPVSEQ